MVMFAAVAMMSCKSKTAAPAEAEAEATETVEAAAEATEAEAAEAEATIEGAAQEAIEGVKDAATNAAIDKINAAGEAAANAIAK